MKHTDLVNATASSPTEAYVSPCPDLPRVGIVAVSLPADSYALRSVWLDTDTLMVGFDPARLTRSLVELILDQQIGAYLDIDAEVTA